MKALKSISAIALAMTVLLSLGVLTVAAQAPTGSTPSQVAFLDNQTHSIGPNSSQLFKFNYAINGDDTRPTTNIRLVNGTNSGVNFEVWTSDGLNNMMNSTAQDIQANASTTSPIGRGTSPTIDCNTGEISGSGSCQSPDLVWSGTFGSSGTYFVRVVNSSGLQSNYKLLIDGTGVSLSQPQAQTAPAPAAPAQGPVAAPPLVAASSDPFKSGPIDGQSHSIAAGTSTWYSFSYSLNSDDTRPTVMLTMPNGAASGMAFEVWTADEINNMNSATAQDIQSNPGPNSPVGRGTAATVDCNTGEISGSGSCQSPDLVWSGTFGTSGTYYVHVVNNNASAPQTAYQLTIATQ